MRLPHPVGTHLTQLKSRVTKWREDLRQKSSDQVVVLGKLGDRAIHQLQRSMGTFPKTMPILLTRARRRNPFSPDVYQTAMFRIVQLAYLMLPIYLANMAAPFARHWGGWNRPISRRWLGSHKTVLGFALGVAAAVAVVFVQGRVRWSGSLISYDQWLVLGVGCGLGALGGDSIKSFFKRQLNIAPGRSWVPADQLDFVVGGLIVLSFWTQLSWLDIVCILALSFIGDIIVNHAAFYLGIRDTKW